MANESIRKNEGLAALIRRDLLPIERQALFCRKRDLPADSALREQLLMLKGTHFRFLEQTVLAGKNTRIHFAGHGSQALLDLHRAIEGLNQPIKEIIPPQVVEIQPSSDEKCSAKCPHCISRYLLERGGASFAQTADDYFKGPRADVRAQTLIRQIGDYWKEKGVKRGEIKISGASSDPGQSVPLVRIMAEEARKYEDRIKFAIFTNGLHIREMMEGGLHHLADSLYISLDGINARTLTAVKGVGKEEVERAKKLLAILGKEKSERTELVLGYIITSVNYREALQAFEWAKDNGISGIRYKWDFTRPEIKANPAIIENLNNTFQNLEVESRESGDFSVIAPLPHYFTQPPEFGSQFFFRYCVFFLLSATVSRWGMVHPCYHAPSSNPTVTLGNLRHQTFREIWEHERRLRHLLTYPQDWCTICPSSAWFLNYFTAGKYYDYLLSSSLYQNDASQWLRDSQNWKRSLGMLYRRS